MKSFLKFPLWARIVLPVLVVLMVFSLLKGLFKLAIFGAVIYAVVYLATEFQKRGKSKASR
ncbi:MAG: hypothetical protein AAGI38_25275 [Bacteroidota bacterium]